MGALWSKVTGLFRSKPEPVSAAEQINQEILALRERVLQLMQSDPETYLGSPTKRVEPFGPGGRLLDQEIDFCAIKITDDDGELGWRNINSMYYKMRPNLADEEVKAYLLRIAEGDRRSEAVERMSWAEACPSILPRIGLDTRNQTLYLPWGDLVILLVIDFPDTVFYLKQSHLDRWGHTAEEALSVAVANLRRRYGETRARPLPVTDAPDLRAWAVDASDQDANATLVLLPEVTGSVPAPRDTLFVMIPHRTRLMFFERPDSPDRRQDLVTLVAQQNWQAGLPISPHLLVWSGDVLVRATSEEILGYAIEFEEPGAGAQSFVIPDPDTGERRSVTYPLRHNA